MTQPVDGGLDLIYDDTVADLVLSTTGGMIGSALAVTLFPPHRRTLSSVKHQDRSRAGLAEAARNYSKRR